MARRVNTSRRYCTVAKYCDHSGSIATFEVCQFDKRPFQIELISTGNMALSENHRFFKMALSLLTKSFTCPNILIQADAF